MLKETAVNYQLITILNSDHSRLSKQYVEAQIILFLFFLQGGCFINIRNAAILANELNLQLDYWYTEIANLPCDVKQSSLE